MKSIILISFLTFYTLLSTAQEVISNGGDSFNTTFVQLDFTLGELAIETLSASSELTQGFHQGNTTLTGIEVIAPLSFEVFPNPSTDWIQISMDNSKYTGSSYSITDLQGQAVQSDYLNPFNNQKISLRDLSSGTYILHLKIEDENQKVLPIKIIKQ